MRLIVVSIIVILSLFFVVGIVTGLRLGKAEHEIEHLSCKASYDSYLVEILPSASAPRVHWESYRSNAHREVIQCLCDTIGDGRIERSVVSKYILENSSEISRATSYVFEDDYFEKMSSWLESIKQMYGEGAEYQDRFGDEIGFLCNYFEPIGYR